MPRTHLPVRMSGEVNWSFWGAAGAEGYSWRPVRSDDPYDLGFTVNAGCRTFDAPEVIGWMRVKIVNDLPDDSVSIVTWETSQPRYIDCDGVWHDLTIGPCEVVLVNEGSVPVDTTSIGTVKALYD